MPTKIDNIIPTKHQVVFKAEEGLSWSAPANDDIPSFEPIHEAPVVLLPKLPEEEAVCEVKITTRAQRWALGRILGLPFWRRVRFALHG